MPNIKLTVKEKEAEAHAITLWEKGEMPKFSTGICERLTCGYGTLDDNGYWEFPLYPADEYLEKFLEKRKHLSMPARQQPLEGEVLEPKHSSQDEHFLQQTRKLVGTANLAINEAREYAEGISNMNVKKQALDLIEKFWEKGL